MAASKVGSPEKEADFFVGLDTGLESFRLLDLAVREALQAYRAEATAECASKLARVVAAVRELRKWAPESLELLLKQEQANRALAQALGLELSVLVEPREKPSGPFSAMVPDQTVPAAVAGEPFSVDVRLLNPTGVPIATRTGATPIVPPGTRVETAAEGRFQLVLPEQATPTSAFWSRRSVQDPQYALAPDAPFGASLPEPPVKFRMAYEYLGVRANLEAPALVSYLDATGIQRRRVLAIAPPVSLRFSTDAGILPLGRNQYRVQITVTNHRAGPAFGEVYIEIPGGWKADPPTHSYEFTHTGEQRSLEFVLSVPQRLASGAFDIQGIRATLR